MVTEVQTREELHRLIDALSDEEFEDLVDYLNMRNDPGSLTDEERAAIEEGLKEIERGEWISGEELERELGL